MKEARRKGYFGMIECCNNQYLGIELFGMIFNYLSDNRDAGETMLFFFYAGIHFNCSATRKMCQ